jgi:hypothetical protein
MRFLPSGNRSRSDERGRTSELRGDEDWLSVSGATADAGAKMVEG